MAKKNSSKTATEKSIQASEPRVMSYRGWQGVNYSEAPLTWKPLESGWDNYRQSDLADNFLLVQNNMDSCATGALETRRDALELCKPPEGYSFTGVTCMYEDWLLAVVRNDNVMAALGLISSHYIMPYKLSTGKRGQLIRLRRHADDGGDVLDDDGAELRNTDGSLKNIFENYNWYISDMQCYEGKLVVMAWGSETILGGLVDLFSSKDVNSIGLVFLGSIEESALHDTLEVKSFDFSTYTESVADSVNCMPLVKKPSLQCKYEPYDGKNKDSLLASDKIVETETVETDDDSNVTVKGKNINYRLELCYCYTNRMGSTISSPTTTLYVNWSPALWHSGRYLRIYVDEDPIITSKIGVTGVDIYAREKENTNWVFIGHQQVTAGNKGWSYNWLGNMTDISQWTTSQLIRPNENTTRGPDARYLSVHDSRVYYWGSKAKPYRLWIGGNPGAEFSVARGLGGAFVDIEPGSGYEIKSTQKWKTAGGSSIVTMLCGNGNTNKVKRFNLVETNLTITNEISYKSYMYEDVSNVVGCNSRYGSGVFADGLYTLNRYGLMVTTMAMEYNSQMKNETVSEAIAPIFEERLGMYLNSGRLVHINGRIFIALGDGKGYEDDEPVGLGNVVLVYDMALKSWYTWTMDSILGTNLGGDADKVIHIFPVDSERYQEGLGVMTADTVWLYPVTGVRKPDVPMFTSIIETGELMPRMPKQAMNYIQQLEFRFDYMVCDPDDPPLIIVEGCDYYGRTFKMTKKIDRPQPGQGETGELRSWVEWVRLDRYVESYRIRIQGRMRCRLTHVNCKMYQQADVIGTSYGFDALDEYRTRHGHAYNHHYIDGYNNLRKALVT